MLTAIDVDGQGFDADAAGGRSGIQEMRELAGLLGGRLRAKSAKCSGTTLVIESRIG